jgi:hypothetical protein
MVIVQFGNRQVPSEFHRAVFVFARLVETFHAGPDPDFVRLESYTILRSFCRKSLEIRYKSKCLFRAPSKALGKA